LNSLQLTQKKLSDFLGANHASGRRSSVTLRVEEPR
jgi:hypothetical protein